MPESVRPTPLDCRAAAPGSGPARISSVIDRAIKCIEQNTDGFHNRFSIVRLRRLRQQRAAPAATTDPQDVRDPSVARQWNDELLEATRDDFARPTVHARNLWHISAAMCDAWAAYQATSSTYLLGSNVGGFACALDSFPAPALGNYIADCYIQFGLQDGANEVNDYANRFYEPVNPPIEPELPGNPGEYADFYDGLEGGDASTGCTVKPVTGAAYGPQMVPRGDYTRVLAEFWADGPDSETPLRHWFVILNEVNDHPELERRFGGVGPKLGPLEWDVKAYFALGGAMHDSAISAWGIKGWYDYLRPVSAIRAMADRGQGTDPDLPSHSVDGIPLEPGYIELVAPGDPLAGPNDENVGKIKLYAWRDPDFIANPRIDQAGVDWILAENWWPYQRPTLVSPPFAGYVSGHSAYSRAAAEVLTALTGSEYFPGGMSGFSITANEFLVFEDGPSIDMTLQWATYRDAADQFSLSRIWGGIHPPADDIPGRRIGEQIGVRAFSLAEEYFEGLR